MIERRKVDGTQHLGTRHFGLVTKLKHAVFAFCEKGRSTFFNAEFFLLSRFCFLLFFNDGSLLFFNNRFHLGRFFRLRSLLLHRSRFRLRSFLLSRFTLLNGFGRSFLYSDCYFSLCRSLFLLRFFGFAENLCSLIVKGFVGAKLLLEQGILLIIDLLIRITLERTAIGIEIINNVLQADVKFFDCFI